MKAKSVNLIVATDSTNIDVGGQNLRLDLLDGWKDLNGRQQRYLVEYAYDPHNKTIGAMKLGYSKSEINNWFSQETFSSVANQIFEIYTDYLKACDYADGVTNSKIRSRVIKAQENDGKYTEDKKTEHQHLHIYTMKDVLKDLK